MPSRDETEEIQRWLGPGRPRRLWQVLFLGPSAFLLLLWAYAPWINPAVVLVAFAVWWIVGMVVAYLVSPVERRNTLAGPDAAEFL